MPAQTQSVSRLTIRRVETLVLAAEVDERGNSRGSSSVRAALLVRVYDNDGRCGVGEAYGSGGVHMCRATASIVEEILAPMILGNDASQPEVLWWQMYIALREQARNGLLMHGLAAVDIALWDLSAQALGVPLHRLLGGSGRTRLQTYASGLMYRATDDLRELGEEASRLAESGFPLVKLRAGRRSVRDDVARVRAVRDAVGATVDIAVDANQAYTVGHARLLVSALSELGCVWLEEPLPPEDRRGYAELRVHGYLPIAGGESEHSAWGIDDLARGRCVDLLQPEPCGLGGVTEFRRAVTVASLASLPVIPHSWGTGVAAQLNVHLAAALPPTISGFQGAHIEWDATINPLRDDLLTTPLHPDPQSAAIDVPTDPGLGVALDEEALRRWKIAGRVVRST